MRAALTVVLFVLMAGNAGTQSSRPIIVDSNAGTDDLLAIAYLLSAPDIQIEAITVVHGLAHVREGAHNFLPIRRSRTASFRGIVGMAFLWASSARLSADR